MSLLFLASLTTFVYFMTNILSRIRWTLNLVLIYISLVVNEAIVFCCYCCLVLFMMSVYLKGKFIASVKSTFFPHSVDSLMTGYKY